MAWGRTKLELMGSPPLLLEKGAARLRVRGWGLGALRCQGERRWVWGAFDETFVVRASAADSLRVALRGPLGTAALDVPFQPRARLQAPPFVLPSSRAGVASRARLRRLRVAWPTLRPPKQPRVRRLRMDDLKGGAGDEHTG